MALTATIYRWQINLSDVDRNVYQEIDLRLARHPSETMRYLITRAIAYCLNVEEGLAFSKGLSTAEEPAVWTHDLQGTLTRWIEIGMPAADRLHKARKGCDQVAIYMHQDPAMLRRAIEARPVFKAETIPVYVLEASFLDALEAVLDRQSRFEMVRTDGQLYVTIDGKTIEGTLAQHSLA